MSQQNKGHRGFTRRIIVGGENLISTVKTVFKDPTAKRITIRTKDGKELLRVPVSVGVAAGTIGLLMAPVMSAIAAMGGAVAELTLEVEHDSPPGEPRRSDDEA